MLPHTVPTVRMARWAICGATSWINGARRAMSGDRSAVAWRTRAPKVTSPESPSDTVSNPRTRPMSMRWAGAAKRIAIIGSRLWPPARIFASSPCSASRTSASSRLSDRWYSNCGIFTNRDRKPPREAHSTRQRLSAPSGQKRARGSTCSSVTTGSRPQTTRQRVYGAGRGSLATSLRQGRCLRTRS